MKDLLIIGTAPNDIIDKALGVIQEKFNKNEWRYNFLSSRKIDDRRIKKFIFTKSKFIDEKDKFDFSDFENIIMCQSCNSIVFYRNVYKFLKNNKVIRFSIITPDMRYIEVKTEDLIDAMMIKEDDKNKKTIFYIDPLKIKEGVSTLNQLDYGKTIDGDWDLSSWDFDETVPFFRSFRDVIKNLKKWDETDYYNFILEKIENGTGDFDCKTKQELIERCRKFEILYSEIEKNGWKQTENSDFITIAIDRKGNPLFLDGRHRLVIAKLLKINKIPVKIAVRHKNWVEFKSEILKYAEENNGLVYAPINHFELETIPYLHDSRFDVIIKNIDKNSKTVIDIGSHWGFIASKIEETGRKCTAVESIAINCYFMEKIREASNQKFRIIKDDIFKFIDRENKFDTVIALNFFHHYIKTKEKYEMLKYFLKKLNMKEMFFQAHRTTECQMKGSFKNYDAYEFVDFIIENSSLNKYRELNDYDGRKLFHIY